MKVGARVAPFSNVAFRLPEDEPVAEGLRRVARKELRTAAERLASDPSDEAIHEARKSIKKVRAVLQLVGDELGGESALKDLRRASHRLSSLRDIDAMIETARSLGSGAHHATSASVPALRSHLSAQKVTLTQAADERHTRAKSARALDRVRRDARDWRWKRIELSTLVKAITRSYQRARRAMPGARHGRKPETFHDWRKRIKTLWYGLRMLEDHAPRLRRAIADFKRLETWLGDDHNLVVLQKHVRSLPSSRRPARGRVPLHTVIDQRQQKLRRQALTLGARLFAESPKAFMHRLRRIQHPRGRLHSPAAAA